MRDAAETAEKNAEAKAISHLRSTAPYEAAKRERESLSTRLEEARAHGSPLQKLDASRAFVASDQKIKQMEREAVNADPDVLAARAAVDSALTAVEDKRQQNSREILAERARIQSSPENVAMREGRIIVGMTEDQGERAFQRRPMSKWSERGGAGNRDVAMDVPAGSAIAALPSATVFKKIENDYGTFRRVIFRRVSQSASGREDLLDQAVVTIADGKVIQVLGN